MLANKDKEGRLFEVLLEDICDLNNSLVILSKKIDWEKLSETFHPLYCTDFGRPAKEVRLMIGLQYLKYTFNVSDEALLPLWVENPYWQYFCGEKYFQHKPPINPSLMSKFRKKVKSTNLEKLLEETIRTGLEMKVIKKTSFKEVVADTTVQEKNVTYPTDAKLYYRMIRKLSKRALSLGIELRQSFVRVGKKALMMQARYFFTRKTKLGHREVRKLKTYLGRLFRDIKRKDSGSDTKLKELLELAERLLNQKRTDKNKLYSLHEPEVECISKGKKHKKYEFGNKSSFIVTAKESFVVGALAFKGSPYDGHTLKDAMEQTERMIGKNVKHIAVDLGYRGHNYEGEAEVHIVGRKKYKKYKMKKRFRRRASIEPMIGHMKNDGRLGRNYLSGIEGNEANTILSACGQNMRKLLKAIFWPLFNYIKNQLRVIKLELKRVYFQKMACKFLLFQG